MPVHCAERKWLAAIRRLMAMPGTEVASPKVVPLEPLGDLYYAMDMDRAEAVTKLKAHEAELKQLGTQHLQLFGSTARGDARLDSDIELFFDYERGRFSPF